MADMEVRMTANFSGAFHLAASFAKQLLAALQLMAISKTTFDFSHVIANSRDAILCDRYSLCFANFVTCLLTLAFRVFLP